MAANQFGRVSIEGKEYIERVQVFPDQVAVTVGLQVITGLRIALPGVAPFLLKGLTRTVVNAAGPAVLRFRFRFGNSDGGAWYTAAGIGGVSDRVVDNLIFGTAQFPYVLTPPILYGANSSITYEIEDLAGAGAVPYTIYLGFHGSYLLSI